MDRTPISPRWTCIAHSRDLRTRRLAGLTRSWRLAGVGAIVLGAGCGSSQPRLDTLGDASRADTGVRDGAAPDAREASTARLVTIPLSGCSAGFYTVPTSIRGSKTFELIFDTGSTTMGVASSACASCADGGVSPLYAPAPPAVDE